MDKALWKALHKVGEVHGHIDIYTGVTDYCETCGDSFDSVSLAYESEEPEKVDVVFSAGCFGGGSEILPVDRVRKFLLKELRDSLYEEETVQFVMGEVEEFLELLE